jgi:hypothetical protein
VWALRNDNTGGNFYLDRFNPSNAAYIDSPFYIAPTGTGSGQAQIQIGGQTVMHGGNYMVPILISALPACSGSNAGMLETISNGVAAPVYGAAVGTTTGPSTGLVMCNNTNWVYH